MFIAKAIQETIKGCHPSAYDGVIPVPRHWDPEILVNVKFCVEKCNVFDDYGKPVSSTGMTGIKEALGLQCNLVIPARDAGI